MSPDAFCPELRTHIAPGQSRPELSSDVMRPHASMDVTEQITTTGEQSMIGTSLARAMSVLAACWWLLPAAAVARDGDVTFNVRLHELDAKRSDAPAEGKNKQAAELSQQIGELHVSHEGVWETRTGAGTRES